MKPEEVTLLERFLRKRLNLPSIEVRQTAEDEKAEVYLGQVAFAQLLRDEDEGELSYVFEQSFRLKREDKGSLEKQLRARFNNDLLEVRSRPQKNDSDEIYIVDEFVAVLYKDEMGEEIAYHIAMSILDIDLEDC